MIALKHTVTPADACINLFHAGLAAARMSPAPFPAEKTLSEFTGMISTSNHIMDDTVMVETDADVIWITETAL